jgi:RecA/RadA recombinase
VSAGGHAIKFYSSIRVEFSKTQNLFDKDKDGAKHFLGQITKMELTKNKVSHTGIMDFKVPLVDIGFDTYEGLFEAYKTMGLMEKVNQKTWLFKPADVQVSKKDWRIFVESQGGLWEAYKNFLKIAQEREDIKPYGGTNG